MASTGTASVIASATDTVTLIGVIFSTASNMASTGTDTVSAIAHRTDRVTLISVILIINWNGRFMDNLMAAKLICLDESLTADITGIWFFSCMCFSMYF